MPTNGVSHEERVQDLSGSNQPIDPPQHNVNSRFALETAELVRAQKGDGEAGAFCHHVSRAFFAEHADISKREVIVAIAESSANGP